MCYSTLMAIREQPVEVSSLCPLWASGIEFRLLGLLTSTFTL